MNYHIILSRDSENDITNIFNYIAQDNPLKATSFTYQLQNYIQKMLSDMPKSGRLIKGRTRMLVYKKYVILYTIYERKKIVSILNIFSKGRNWR